MSGGADGVDTLAERYAEENHFAFRKMPADWNRYGKRAGYIRNDEMHRFISGFEHRGCIAFWDGRSKGTLHSIELAKKYGNPIRLIRSKRPDSPEPKEPKISPERPEPKIENAIEIHDRA